MYLRFSLTRRDNQSFAKQGIIIAAVSVRDDALLEKAEDDELRSILKWFNENLKVPEILGEDGMHRALSWFRADAREHVQKAWELARLLQANGFHVEVHKTHDPGIPIYEDESQIVAIGRKGSRAI